MKTKVTILGCGYGKKVIYKAFLKNKNYKIVDIISPRKLNISSEKASPLSLEVKKIFYSDYSDCIVIAAPPSLQYELLKHCVLGNKCFICEKPFNLDLLKAEKVHNDIIKYNLKCAVGYQFRYDPFILTVENIIKELNLTCYDNIDIKWHSSGSLSKEKILSWRDSKRESYGVLSEWCSHVFDYVKFLTGLRFREISCKASSNVKFRKDINGEYFPVDTPDELRIKSKLDFDTKCDISINTASLKENFHSIRLIKEKTDITITIKPPYFPENITIKSNQKLKNIYNIPSDKEETRILSYYRLTSDFHNYLQNISDTPRLAKSIDALEVWECINASLESIKDNNKFKRVGKSI